MGKNRDTSPRRHSFSLSSLKWILIGIVILVLAFLITAKPVFNIDLSQRIRDKRKTSSSSAVLEEVRDVFLFQTVEYVYKTVFPYDFMPEDYDWGALLDKANFNQPMTPEEHEYLDFFFFCKELGINLKSNRNDFAVITALVRGGFNLEGTIYESPDTVENIDEYVWVDQETQTLYLTLPDPVISEFIIEDPTTSTYFYPDLGISPENWKRLVEFTSARIEEQVLAEGILEHARRRGKNFLEALLLQTELKKIEFIE